MKKVAKEKKLAQKEDGEKSKKSKQILELDDAYKPHKSSEKSPKN